MLKGELKDVQGLCISPRNKYGFSQNKNNQCGEVKKLIKTKKKENVQDKT